MTSHSVSAGKLFQPEHHHRRQYRRGARTHQDRRKLSNKSDDSVWNTVALAA